MGLPVYPSTTSSYGVLPHHSLPEPHFGSTAQSESVTTPIYRTEISFFFLLFTTGVILSGPSESPYLTNGSQSSLSGVGTGGGGVVPMSMGMSMSVMSGGSTGSMSSPGTTSSGSSTSSYAAALGNSLMNSAYASSPSLITSQVISI